METTGTTSVLPGVGGLSKVCLAAPDGARAEVYLQGAHLTSWIPAGGEERLFLSRTAEFQAGMALRGGVPVIFPQFSGLGPLPKHGFARASVWEFAGTDTCTACVAAKFLLRDSATTRARWPHAFLAELTVMLGGPWLEIALAVTNTGPAAFGFTAALHTYLRVAEARATVVEGLGGVRYRDEAAGGDAARLQPEPALTFEGEVDRLYLNAPRTVIVREPDRQVESVTTGFPDLVVWNPWADRGAALRDLEPEGYRRMVCVEAAAAGTPVHLNPDAGWCGSQRLTAG